METHTIHSELLRRRVRVHRSSPGRENRLTCIQPNDTIPTVFPAICNTSYLERFTTATSRPLRLSRLSLKLADPGG